MNANEKGAYGLRISGDAMWPALRHGDVAWFDPAWSLAIDNEVVIYRAGDDQESCIGTLVAYDDVQWTIELLKPKHTETLARAEWPICHMCAGKAAFDAAEARTKAEIVALVA